MEDVSRILDLSRTSFPFVYHHFTYTLTRRLSSDYTIEFVLVYILYVIDEGLCLCYDDILFSVRRDDVDIVFANEIQGIAGRVVFFLLFRSNEFVLSEFYIVRTNESERCI